MDLIPPLGKPPGSPWEDADAATGTDGSLIAADAVAHPMEEIVNAIRAASLKPDREDRTQLTRAITILAGKGVADGLKGAMEGSRFGVGVWGFGCLATDQQTLAGTSDGLAVSPAGLGLAFERRTIRDGGGLSVSGDLWNGLTLALSDADTSTAGGVRLADEDSAKAGSDTVRVLTPATVRAVLQSRKVQASGGLAVSGNLWDGLSLGIAAGSSAVVGAVRFATPAEVAQGTLGNAAVTPAGLTHAFTTRKATEMDPGPARIASRVQAVAGQDDTTIMTPAKTRAVMDTRAAAPSSTQVITVSGNYRFAKTGLARITLVGGGGGGGRGGCPSSSGGWGGGVGGTTTLTPYSAATLLSGGLAAFGGGGGGGGGSRGGRSQSGTPYFGNPHQGCGGGGGGGAGGVGTAVVRVSSTATHFSVHVGAGGVGGYGLAPNGTYFGRGRDGDSAPGTSNGGRGGGPFGCGGGGAVGAGNGGSATVYRVAQDAVSSKDVHAGGNGGAGASGFLYNGTVYGYGGGGGAGSAPESCSGGDIWPRRDLQTRCAGGAAQVPSSVGGVSDSNGSGPGGPGGPGVIIIEYLGE